MLFLKDELYLMINGGNISIKLAGDLDAAAARR